MRIKQNPLIKGIVVLLIIVPVYFIISDRRSDESEQPSTSKPQAATPVVTENEAIAAMSGYLTTVERDQRRLEENMLTRADIESIIESTRNRASGAINEQDLLAKVSQLVEERTEDLKRSVLERSQVRPTEVGSIDDQMPFSDAFEVNTRSSSRSERGGATSAGSSSDEIAWAYPVGFSPEANKSLLDGVFQAGSAFGEGAGRFVGGTADTANRAAERIKEELQPIPFATIHSDSSIHDATALTALIGRIERQGRTHDPFRFQIMLSGDTLMANGHTMPGVANAIVSGVGTGDMAFACVRGRVTSITFNFDDGRIFNQRGTYEAPLAEIGDRWGNPCVRGHLVDDVEKFIAAQGIVAGLSSYADTISKQQQTITSTGNTTGLSLTGDAGKLAAGSMAAGGLSEVGSILAKRYESYYEAIYVPPGEKVSLLFIEDIEIDYVPTNRKISYETSVRTFGDFD